MNYQEALTLIRQGRKVRLPEWTGYWFLPAIAPGTPGPAYTIIKAFTRTGDVVNAWVGCPAELSVMHRTDWQEVTSHGLGYDFAILAMKAGKRVSRAGWNGKGMYCWMEKGAIDHRSLKIQGTNDLIPKENLGYIDGVSLAHFERWDDGIYPSLPYFRMKSASGAIVNGWLASQTDMLAEDWSIAPESTIYPTTDACPEAALPNEKKSLPDMCDVAPAPVESEVFNQADMD